MSSSEATAGTTLFGRYCVERELGRGGWGVVYLVHDTSLDVPVALKVLADHLVRDHEAIERFKRELRLARTVTHPGICRVFDLHEIDGAHFITMEYVAGKSLDSVIRDEAPLQVDRAVRIARAVCRALDAAHRAGVTHRDLKPNNIILRRDGRPAILDFGFATSSTAVAWTAPQLALATLRYCAPELMEGAPASPASDVYSLGVILYRCLTGKYPRSLPAAGEVGKAAALPPPVSVAELNPAVSAELDRVVLTAVAASTKDRYASAVELEQALATACPERPTHGIAQARLNQLTPWDRDIDGMVTQVLGTAALNSMLRRNVSTTTVLFSDIVGITRFFDRYGDVAGYRRIAQHNAMLFPVVDAHSGSVVKTIGDAIMATFADVGDGVRAAIDMQRRLAAHNQRVEDPKERIRVRIGINSGEALMQKSDVFGSTVNVAARISALASGEEILITDTTWHALKNSSLVAKFHSSAALRGKSGLYSIYSVQWREGEPPSIAFADELSDGDIETAADVAQTARHDPSPAIFNPPAPAPTWWTAPLGMTGWRRTGLLVLSAAAAFGALSLMLRLCSEG